jgi:hypothetical protein
MKIEEIKDQAQVDLHIDKTNLTNASIDAPLLVNKYYAILIDEVRVTKALEGHLAILYKEKYDYYLGFADPKIYVSKPFNRKVLKGDVDMYISADQDYISMMNKIETQNVKIKYLEEIIKQLNQRTFIVKNIIAEMQFKNGGY